MEDGCGQAAITTRHMTPTYIRGRDCSGTQGQAKKRCTAYEKAVTNRVIVGLGRAGELK